jgi:hypothetical protein
MADASQPFPFSQFVPGFDFLKNLATASETSAARAVPGLPSLSSWVAPTLSVEEVDKRIQELKTVQFWLEQNLHALKATIQALEVQKMTLSTLRGMNLRMEDLASAFTRSATAAASAVPAASAPAAAPAPAPEPAPEPEPPAARTRARASASKESAAREAGGVVDPLQWWGALTQQFQEIASGALKEAAKLPIPVKLNSAAAGKKGAAAEAAKPNGAGARSAKASGTATKSTKTRSGRRPGAASSRR